jgi:hypothetical protein
MTVDKQKNLVRSLEFLQKADIDFRVWQKVKEVKAKEKEVKMEDGSSLVRIRKFYVFRDMINCC